MKKNVFALAALVLGLTMFIACSHDSDNSPHTDPSLLVGKWVKVSAGSPASFVITYTPELDDLIEFTCVITVPVINEQACVTGKLYFDPTPGWGKNDYTMYDLGTDDSYDGGDYADGNAYVIDNPLATLASMENVRITLAPLSGDRFQFSSKNSAAQAFFGGTFQLETTP